MLLFHFLCITRDESETPKVFTVKYLAQFPPSTQKNDASLTRLLVLFCPLLLLLLLLTPLLQHLQLLISHKSLYINLLPPSSFWSHSLSLFYPFSSSPFIVSLLADCFKPSGWNRQDVCYKSIQGFLHLCNKNFVAVYKSEMAVQLLRGGCSAHSTFKLPICGSDSDTCNVSGETQLATNLWTVYFIIWY